MKKGLPLYVFYLVAIVLFYSGCSFSSDPQTVILQYLNNYYHGNYEKAYALLSSQDKAVTSLQEFSGNKAEINAIMKTMSNKITFEVKDVKVTGDNALATVDITMPDLMVAMRDQMAETFAQGLGGHEPDKKAIEQKIAEKINNKNLPTVTNTAQFNLVKENDGWRVYMGWKTKKN